jgi:hypothetical protein
VIGNKNYHRLIERLKCFLKENKISHETFANHVLNIKSREMRKLLANKVSWNNLTAVYQEFYETIEKWLNNDKNLFDLEKKQLNKINTIAPINANSSNPASTNESPGLPITLAKLPITSSNGNNQQQKEKSIIEKNLINKSEFFNYFLIKRQVATVQSEKQNLKNN